ncbi:MFS general substrate transporter [Glarea lozoyensis ATCC 20868]|uniref:MFS general substrate transporter n=1 Tax=Glarea lozoyensis (strain ATCC 20868 / MF5171) TaxID=1116229 RepID=S3DSU7_GLAL2|nr:MFS general substrate transporter [Glarea lozoyensis ATCC 20868]EPE29508.1 MFS general substrate transporter [Glarea lozoyensis ATCC 20868]
MADTAEEPLMGQSSHEDDLDATDEVDLSDVSLLLEKNLRHPGVFVWLLTFSAGISGLLFGYDTGVISATLVSINSSLGHPLTTLDKSLITSATALFALLVSPVSGVLADSLGRKRVVLLADLAFILGAVIQAVAGNVAGMIVGRSVVGLAVGAGSFVAPLYIAELAPAPFRGRLITLNVLFITIGQVIAYIVGWAFVQWGNQATGWRWMVGLGAVPAGLQCLVMIIMPETPRWLVMVDRRDEAKNVLRKVFGSGVEIEGLAEVVLEGIENEVREEEEAKRGRNRSQSQKQNDAWFSDSKDLWLELFRVSGNRRALAIACLLQGLQQLCGFNSLMYFSATIFTIVGFASPTLTSLSVALTNFVLTCLALLLIDRIGRRKILLYSIPIMSLGLLFCAIGFHFITLPENLSLDNPSSSANANEEIPLSERTAPMLVLASIMLYVGAYALGLGNVPWMQSELFPLNVRSFGSGLSTSTNWSANFVVGLTFLPMMEFLTPAWTFVIYAGVCVAGWLAVWRIYPETKGLSLEEVGALLAEGWGVRGVSRG